MPNFYKEDLLFIEAEATKVLKEELKARTILPVDTNFDPNASQIGYDIFDTHGSAKIFAGGGNAKDIPFVGEEKKRETQAVYTIATGIKYEKAEREAVESARRNGKGSNYNLDSERPMTARRFVAEKENQIAFTGDAIYNLKGILDSSFFGAGKGTSEAVTGGVWSAKTPSAILADIRKGIKTASKDGLFTGPKTVVLPYDQWFLLTQPFNDGTERTILDWLRASLPGMINFEFFNIMKNANNGGIGSDAMLILSPDPMLVKLAITKDLTLLPPVFDLLENSEQALVERIAGIVVKHPSSLYIGSGI